MNKTKNSNLKRGITLALVVVMLMSLFIQMAAADEVTAASDFDYSSHWARDTIIAYLERDILSADSNGNVKPDENITRGEMAQIINAALGFTEEATTSFSDINSDDKYYQDMLIAKGMGYMVGDGSGNGMADTNITRQDFSIILGRLLNLTPDKSLTSETFTDTDSMTEEGQGYIGTLAQKGIVQGYAGKFNPKDNIKRSEAATMVFRAESVYNNKAYANAVVGEDGKLGSANTAPRYINDLTVTGAGATIENAYLYGDLIIAAAVGSGDVTLKNVTVRGNVIVRGGGKDSINATNCVFGNIIYNDAKGEARIVMDEKTTFADITFKSGGAFKFEGKRQIEAITIDENLPKDAKVIIEGNVKIINVNGGVNLSLNGQYNSVIVAEEATGTTIATSATTTINALIVNSAVKVTGKGTITIAVLNVSGSTFETAPKNTTDNASSTPAPASTDTSSSTTSGGTSTPSAPSPSTPTVAVTEVTLSETEATLEIGQTLQLTATVKPDNATNKTVTWTSSDASVATVNKGTVTALAGGTVTITARTSNNKTATCEITVPAAPIGLPYGATVTVDTSAFVPVGNAAVYVNIPGVETISGSARYTVRYNGEAMDFNTTSKSYKTVVTRQNAGYDYSQNITIEEVQLPELTDKIATANFAGLGKALISVKAEGVTSGNASNYRVYYKDANDNVVVLRYIGSETYKAEVDLIPDVDPDTDSAAYTDNIYIEWATN